MSNSAFPFWPTRHAAAGAAARMVYDEDQMGFVGGRSMAVLESVTLGTPPGSPVAGLLYGVPAGASAPWNTQAGKIARHNGTAWEYREPAPGDRAFVLDEGRLATWSGGRWVRGLIGAKGTMAGLVIREVTTAALVGATVDVGGLIKAGDLVLAIAGRVVTAVTGATTFDVGIAGAATRYASNVAITLDTTWQGTATPVAYAADTNVLLTADTSAFTAGVLSLAAVSIAVGAPSA